MSLMIFFLAEFAALRPRAEGDDLENVLHKETLAD
jgi:hypothetical protein